MKTPATPSRFIDPDYFNDFADKFIIAYPAGYRNEKNNSYEPHIYLPPEALNYLSEAIKYNQFLRSLDVKLDKVDQDLQGVLDDLQTLSKMGRATPPKPTSWLVRKIRNLF